MRKPLTVTVITDTHYYSKKLGASGSAYEIANNKSGVLLAESAEMLEAAFTQIANDNRTDIVLLSGDTTSNGDYDSHKEFIEMLRGLKEKGKRVYVLTATHDYQWEGTHHKYVGSERVTIPAAKREELFDMYKEFGPDEALAVHKESMSYIIQLADGYRLFALNDDTNRNGKSGFSDECFRWIKEQIVDAKTNDQFIVAMTHHPLIAPSPMYEIIGHGDMMGDYDIRREQFADLGVQFMLTGHTHVHDIDKYVSPKGNYFYDISTASTIGYPGTIRTVVFDAENKVVSTTTDLVTEPVKFDTHGKDLQTYLGDHFIGTIRDIIKAAGENIDKFADMATAISIKKKVSYKFGWILKPIFKFLNSLKIGTVGNWTRAETGLKKEDYADIKDKSVVDFIVDIVLNLFGGKNLYTPEDNEYKIAIGLINIIDSIIKVLHIPLKKLIKVSDTVRGIIEPLLYNDGIPSYDAIMPIMPVYEGDEVGPQPEKPAKPDTVKDSKKGLPIVIVAILFILTFLVPILLLLLIGFIVNQIKYGKYLK